MSPSPSFLWLAGVPTVFALTAWIDLVGPLGPNTSLTDEIALVPLLGLLVALENALASRRWWVLVPVIPFAVAAIAFPFAMQDLSVMCRYEVDCVAGPEAAYGIGTFLPFLAFLGGVGSWILTPEPGQSA